MSAPRTLFQAILDGDLTKVKELITTANVNTNIEESCKGAPPLALATLSGHLSIVSCKGAPPLALATLSGHLSIVQFLLEKKANIEGKCVTFNATALAYAIEHYNKTSKGKFLPIIFYLIEQGANVLDPSLDPELKEIQDSDLLKQLILKLRKFKKGLKEKAARTALQNDIGLWYKSLGRSDLAIKWSKLAADEGSRTGAWHYAGDILSSDCPTAIAYFKMSYIIGWDAVKDREEVLEELIKIAAIYESKPQTDTSNTLLASQALAELYFAQIDKKPEDEAFKTTIPTLPEAHPVRKLIEAHTKLKNCAPKDKYKLEETITKCFRELNLLGFAESWHALSLQSMDLEAIDEILKEQKNPDRPPQELFDLCIIAAEKTFKDGKLNYYTSYLEKAYSLYEAHDLHLNKSIAHFLNAIPAMMSPAKILAQPIFEETIPHVHTLYKISYEAAKNNFSLAKLFLKLFSTGLGPLLRSFLDWQFSQKPEFQSLPSQQKTEVENNIAKHKSFIDAMLWLYPLEGQPKSALKAIPILEKLVKDEKDSQTRSILNLSLVDAQLTAIAGTKDVQVISSRIESILTLYQDVNFALVLASTHQIIRVAQFSTEQQLVRIISLIQNIFIKILDYQTSEHYIPFLIRHISKIQKINQPTTWKTFMDALVFLHNHLDNKIIKEAIVKELRTFETYLDPFQSYTVHLALAKCYETYRDAATLQESARHYELASKLALTAGVKFEDAVSLAQVYKRLAKTEAKTEYKYFTKAAKLRDPEAALSAAQAIGNDDSEIPKAIMHFQEAIQYAQESKDDKQIVVIAKQLLNFKQERGFLPKEDSALEIDKILMSVYEKLNDAQFVKNAELANELFGIAKNHLTEDEANKRFARYKLSAAIKALLAGQDQEKILPALLTLYSTQTEQVGQQLIEEAIKDFISKFINKGCFTDIVIAPLDQYNPSPAAEQALKTRLLEFAEKELKSILNNNEPIILRRLYNLYLCARKFKELSELQQKFFHSTADEESKSVIHMGLITNLENKSTEIRQNARIALNQIEYQELKNSKGKSSIKLLSHDAQLKRLAQRDHLPAILELIARNNKLAKEFGFKRFIRGTERYVDRRLYLYTKVLLN